VARAPSAPFAALLRNAYRGASDALRARRLAPPEGGGLWWPGPPPPASRAPTSSVSLDRVVRSVSVSEQSDESGTNPSIRHPPSPSMPRPDSWPGTRHQPSNPANHRPSAPGPHRGSRGTYGVVPRPEGPGEDGVLPGNQGVSGGRSPPLMHEQSAWSQPRPRTLCSVGGAYDLCGKETPEGGGLWWPGPPPPASRPCCAMPTAAPPMRSALGALLPLKGEDSGGLGPLRPLRGHPRARSASTESFGA